MALLTATQPTAAGVAWSPAAVSASDTISAANLGQRGAYLVVINGGGSSDTVTVTDASLTPAGQRGNEPDQQRHQRHDRGHVHPAADRQPDQRRDDGDALVHHVRHLRPPPDRLMRR
jgi:hypothetical protein